MTSATSETATANTPPTPNPVKSRYSEKSQIPTEIALKPVHNEYISTVISIVLARPILSPRMPKKMPPSAQPMMKIDVAYVPYALTWVSNALATAESRSAAGITPSATFCSTPAMAVRSTSVPRRSSVTAGFLARLKSCWSIVSNSQHIEATMNTNHMYLSRPLYQGSGFEPSPGEGAAGFLSSKCMWLGLRAGCATLNCSIRSWPPRLVFAASGIAVRTAPGATSDCLV